MDRWSDNFRISEITQALKLPKGVGGLLFNRIVWGTINFFLAPPWKVMFLNVISGAWNEEVSCWLKKEGNWFIEVNKQKRQI